MTQETGTIPRIGENVTEIHKNEQKLSSESQTILMEKDWTYFWKRVLTDITNKDLIPVKLLFFFQYATLFVLYPFLTLHMAELGLDEYEIGINQATAPVIAILGPPFVGIIADKIGNFKIPLSIATLVNAGMALLLLLVPVARETVLLPNFLTFDFSCDNMITQNFILSSIDENLCSINIINESNNNNSVTKVLPSWTNLPRTSIHCGMVCPLPFEKNDEIQPYSRFLELDFLTQNNNNNNMSMKMANGKSYIQFYPHMEPRLACTQSNLEEKCMLDDYNTFSSIDNNNDSSSSMRIQSLKYLNSLGNFDVNVTQLKLEITSGFTLNNVKHDNAVCQSRQNKRDNSNEENCTSQCLIQYDRDIFCQNKQERKIYNVGFTFGIYTLFRLLLGFASAASFIMFEGAVLAIMKQHGGDYGLQRISATLAAIIVAPVSGMMLKAFGFRPVIILYSVLKALSAFVTLAINLEFKKPAEKVVANLKDVLSKPEILIFFVCMLWSGTAWGYLETFLFLYIEKMGGSRLLMGLTISVGGLAGLPLLIFSRPIIKRIGHVNCLCLGLLFYCFRYFGYSFVTNPWQVLIFEALEAVTVSLAITAASTYAVALSNLQTIASIQGIFGCLYFGIGRGAGSFFGGILIKHIGHKQTFRIFGIGSLVGAILYFLANLIYIRKHSIARTGLDLNNLNNINGEKPLSNAIKSKKKKGGKDLEAQKQKEANGGYIGPLTINKFTDVPLDE